MVITNSTTLQTSRNFWRWYAQAAACDFNVGVGDEQGTLVGGFD